MGGLVFTSRFLQDHPRIRLVGSFEALMEARFADGVNAFCWPRTLTGDFEEVVRHLDVEPGITHLTSEQLRSLPLGVGGMQAVRAMLDDLEKLVGHGLQPTLDCINGYRQPEEPELLRTDVCSFHADSATCEADTILCSYRGASSEGLRNEDVIRHVDVPGTRARLLKAYGGEDDGGFDAWLNDHYFDLHYLPLPGAVPFAFGVGNLWRVATLWPGAPVPPCVHRAPDPVPGQKRLLLIS